MCTQSCSTLCQSMNCSPPGSSDHGILQAKILQWAAISYSRGSSQPRDQTCVSCISCIGRWILYSWHNQGMGNSFFFKYLFIYLAVLGLSCSMRNLCPYLQDLCCDMRYPFSCGMWNLVHAQGWNLSPLHWELRVLATGPPG